MGFPFLIFVSAYIIYQHLGMKFYDTVWPWLTLVPFVWSCLICIHVYSLLWWWFNTVLFSIYCSCVMSLGGDEANCLRPNRRSRSHKCPHGGMNLITFWNAHLILKLCSTTATPRELRQDVAKAEDSNICVLPWCITKWFLHVSEYKMVPAHLRTNILKPMTRQNHLVVAQ